MAYLEEIRNQLQTRNYQKVLQLWQEYVQGESADPEELPQILAAIKNSELAKQFGILSLEVLPQVMQFKTFEEQLESLKAIYDLETQDSPELRDIAINFLKTHYENAPLFNEKLRLVGLRGGTPFQGAIANFCLLNHLQKNNFVLHTAGWGVGEIIDVSFVREQAAIEFEHLGGGKKDISFKNAFKTLLPVAKTHFLARRFANADQLEKEARENPALVIRCLLESLGPRTASEIKDEMVDYVIPEAEYSKWWQQARAKLKKDPLLDVPESAKEPFRVRKGHASLHERLEKAFTGKKDFYACLAAANTLVRDFPEFARQDEAKNLLAEKLQVLLTKEKVRKSEKIQVILFLQNALNIEQDAAAMKQAIKEIDSVEETLSHIEILSLKKRFLDEVKEYRSDWAESFQNLLLTIDSNQLRDYILKELSTKEYEAALKQLLGDLLMHPRKHPEALVWYFTKLVDKDAPYFTTDDERGQFLEAFLVLLSYVEKKPEYKDLTKKMALQLTENRFALVREFLKNSPINFAKEFILLASKCHTFTDHDQKIFRSLAEVVHPSLTKEKEKEETDYTTIWTTEAGYQKTQERIKHIGTVEMVDVAKEIEAARALGDLRENSEFKFAQERRGRLQAELKLLSDLFHKARIITPDDIKTDSVSIGSKVSLIASSGEKLMYTILGPWDADTENNILSFQSKFAQELLGKKLNDTLIFKDEEFKIIAISSYLG